MNQSDRLTFDASDSRIIHEILIKGGQIQFLIQEYETPITQYQFTIPSADWYDNAYQKMISQ